MRSVLLRAVLFAAALGLAHVSFAPPAFAQTEEELDRARALFREGLSLEAAGEWAGALAKFQQVAKVKLTPQVRFHIARTKEHLGRLNEALGEYRIAEYEARQIEADALDEIAEARHELQTRIPKLVITRGEDLSAARIELDEVQLGESQIGRPITVDPGPHRLVVRLPDDQWFAQGVQAQEQKTTRVELERPEDLRGPEQEPKPTAPPPVADDGSSVAPWVVGGIGVASLVASGTFFLLRNEAEGQLDDGCVEDPSRPDPVCPERLRGTQTRGETFAVLSPIALGVGLAGVTVAGIWLLTEDSSEQDGPPTARRGVRLDAVASPELTGVNVVGRF